MPWFKGGKGGEQAPFIVGSDRWLGSRDPSGGPGPGPGQGDAAAMSAVTEDQHHHQGNSTTTRAPADSSGAFAPGTDGVSKYTADTGLRTPSTSSTGGAGPAPGSGPPPPAPAFYPVVYTGLPDTTVLEEAVGTVNLGPAAAGAGQPQHDGIKNSKTGPVEAQEEVLVSVPGAIVHLIDEEESLHLGSGELQLLRLTQEGSGVAVFVRVGADLQWPLFKDECAVRLDPTHYFFTLKVPAELLQEVDEEEEEDGDGNGAAKAAAGGGLRRQGSADVRRALDSSSTAAGAEDGLETLNYGVTFSQPGVDAALARLDAHLQHYSLFTAPTVVQGSGPSPKAYTPPAPGPSGKPPPPAPQPAPAPPPGAAGAAKVVTPEELNGHGQPLTEPNSAVYWTALAPNVADYSSSPARAIAQGSGHLIRGLFWVSQATVANLERGSAYMLERGWVRPRSKGPMELSPRTVRNMKRARNVSKMTAKVAKSVLTGVVTTTGIFTSAVVNSKAGNKFFKLLPGEVALVSLDAFGKVFDAVEHAGRAVLKTSSSVTTEMVTRRYGTQAGEFAEDGFRTTGHVITTAWTVSKIRKAFNPKSLTKTGITKSVLKAAATNQQKT